MADIIAIAEYKRGIEKIQNIKDVENYINVVTTSINQFNTYSVKEKFELYESLAKFNMKIVSDLLLAKYSNEKAPL